MADESQDNTNLDPLLDLYRRNARSFLQPPTGMARTLRFLGPGLILVGSIVGSGELIMTTKLGAQAGFTLLWFVLISCVIKSVVQAELARHVISSGETILVMFNKLPGPRCRQPTWLCVPWLLVVVLSTYAGLGLWTWSAASPSDASGPGFPHVGMLVLIVPCCWVIAALSFAARRRSVATHAWDSQDLPNSGSIRPARIESHLSAERGGLRHDPRTERPMLGWFLWLYLACQLVMFINGGAVIGGAGQALALGLGNVLGPTDSRLWTVAIAVVCGVLLLAGRYRMLERVSTGLVFLFTMITLLCTLLLQVTDHGVTFAEIRDGLAFSFAVIPGHGVEPSGILLTTLGMYAATGIGCWEMMQYTYWCVEKGYARHTGENQPGNAWPVRARGWIRVMYADVLLTMIVFTISTVCFYFLGAAILYPQYDPDGQQTISILQRIFTDSLGGWAATLFVVGAFFVLFSTTFSATAGTSRLVADAMCVMGIVDARDYQARVAFMRWYIVFGLTMATLAYCVLKNPPMMLMISGCVAVVLYPTFGLGTLYLRYRGVDARIQPGRLTTAWLWVCGLALALISPAVGLMALALKQGWVEY